MAVRHAVACALLLLILGTSSGAFAAIGEALTDDDACTDECEDGQEGCCSPICATCACAVRIVNVVLPGAVAMPVPERRAVDSVELAAGQPESPDPGDILHIPIAA